MSWFSRVFSTNWMPTTDQAWVSNDGRKINLKNDVAICVTALENRIMHALAVDELTLRYDISVKSCPHGSKIPKESVSSKCLRHINTLVNPFYRPYNVFGVGLEEALKIDRRRSSYTQLRINDGYNLNVPFFIVECVKFIEKYGLSHNDIFRKIHRPIRLSQLKTLVASGNEFHFTYEKDVLEVAMLLKIYLERMPEGLFTTALEFHVVNATEFAIDERVKFLNYVVKALPRINREVLYMVLSLLRRIAYSQTNNIKSRELNDIFTPVLFRARWITACNAMGILQDLINYFPTIFTLKVKQLDHIYKQMAANYPRKLHESLQRRIHQCHCDESDIPASMHILTSQMRSFDAFKITLHRELNFRRQQSEHFFDPHYHNHLDRNIDLKEVYRPRAEGLIDLDIQLARTASVSQTKDRAVDDPEQSLNSVELQSITTARAEDVEPYVPYKDCRKVAQRVTICLPELDFDTPSTSQAATVNLSHTIKEEDEPKIVAYFPHHANETTEMTFLSQTTAPIELKDDGGNEPHCTETESVNQTVPVIEDDPVNAPQNFDPDNDGDDKSLKEKVAELETASGTQTGITGESKVATGRNVRQQVADYESRERSLIRGSYLKVKEEDTASQADAEGAKSLKAAQEVTDPKIELKGNSSDNDGDESEDDTSCSEMASVGQSEAEQSTPTPEDLETHESSKSCKKVFRKNYFLDLNFDTPFTSHPKFDANADYTFFKSDINVRQHVADIESRERSFKTEAASKTKTNRGPYTLRPRRRIAPGFEVKEEYTASQGDTEERKLLKAAEEVTDPEIELNVIASIRRAAPPLRVKTTAL